MLLDSGEVTSVRHNGRCGQTRFCCSTCKEKVLANGNRHTFARPFRNQADWFVHNTHLVLLATNWSRLSALQCISTDISCHSRCGIRTAFTIHYMAKLCYCQRLRYFWTYPCGCNVRIAIFLGTSRYNDYWCSYHHDLLFCIHTS